MADNRKLITWWPGTGSTWHGTAGGTGLFTLSWRGHRSRPDWTLRTGLPGEYVNAGSDDRAELEKQVAKLAGARVRASYAEDATLLGGAVVRIGSTIYDGSVKAQLQRLKQRLVNA